MKKIILMLVLTALAAASQATLLLKDSFNYNTGALTGQGGWGGGGYTVTNGNLTAPAGFPAASGNRLSISGSSSLVATNGSFTAQTSGTVYMSYLVQFNATKAGAAFHLGGFSKDGGAEYGGLAVSNATASSVYFGLGTRNGLTQQFLPTAFATGVTHMVVVSYKIVTGSANDVINFWLDPALGGAEPVAQLSNTTTGDIGTSVNTVDFKATTPFSYSYIDELRVGTTWGDVAIPEPATVGMLGLGALVTLLFRRIRRG
jgi:hypothetical protein